MLPFLFLTDFVRAADKLPPQHIMTDSEKTIIYVLLFIIGILIILSVAGCIWIRMNNQENPQAQRQRLVPNNSYRFAKTEGQMMPPGMPIFQPVPMPQYYQTPQGFAVNAPQPIPPQQDWVLPQVVPNGMPQGVPQTTQIPPMYAPQQLQNVPLESFN